VAVIRLDRRATVAGVSLLLGMVLAWPAFPAGVDNSDFADWLVSRDVVVRGALVSMQSVSKPLRDGVCRSGRVSENRPPLRGELYRVRPDSVLFGSLRDSVLEVFSFGFVSWQHQPVAGTRVLAWGSSVCSDPGTEYGSILVLKDNGGLQPEGYESIRLEGCSYETPCAYSSLLGSLAQRRLRHPAFAFDGAVGAALVRITGFTRRGMTVELLSWRMGERVQLPSYIRFSGRWPFDDRLTLGDSLLLPCRNAAADTVWTMNWPASLWVIRNHFVPALSVDLDRLVDALETRADTLHLLMDCRPH